MPSTTKYDVIVDGETVATKSKKAVAIALADETRADRKSAVSVVTSNGTVVYDVPAPGIRKAYAHPKPFTRVVAGTKSALKGYVVAYDRPIRDAVVLRSMKADKDERYAVTKASSGELVGFSSTTRGAGQLMLELPKVSLAKTAA